MKMGYVYELSFDVLGKTYYYIGATRSGLDWRLTQHFYHPTSDLMSRLLYNFDSEIKAIVAKMCTDNTLRGLEQKQISLYIQEYGPRCVNTSISGYKTPRHQVKYRNRTVMKAIKVSISKALQKQIEIYKEQGPEYKETTQENMLLQTTPRFKSYKLNHNGLLRVPNDQLEIEFDHLAETITYVRKGERR